MVAWIIHSDTGPWNLSSPWSVHIIVLDQYKRQLWEWQTYWWRECICGFFSPRKALWPCLHLVQSSLKWIPQSSALAVCWFNLWAVLVSKTDSSWRKQNPKFHLGDTQTHSRHHWDQNQWLVLRVASCPMCDGARSPVRDRISSEAKPSQLHTL